MKGAIAAFVAAAATGIQGDLSLLITGDEEGEATDGTVRVLEWMEAKRKNSGFLPGGRADQPEAARRCGENRPAGQFERAHHRARDGRAMRPIRIWPTIRSTGWCRRWRR